MSENSLFRKITALLWLKTKKRKIIALLIILILGFLGWRVFGNNNKPVRYQTTKVERGTLISSLSASGQVISIGNENVTTQATGVIKNIFVKAGDLVEKGQTIAEIDLDLIGQERQSKAWADYLSAKNTLDSAQAKSNSLQSAMLKANQAFVNDKGTINPTIDDPKYIEEKADWLAAEANYINQKNVIEQAQIALNSAWLLYLQTASTVTAPIPGTISDLTIATGARFSGFVSSTPITLKIAGIKTFGNPSIVLNLSEIDAPKVKLGNKVILTFDAIPGKSFAGKVAGIDTLGVVASGVTNYPIILAMDAQEIKIFPNMSVSGDIIIAEKSNVLIIPVSAIQIQGDQSFVRIFKNGTLQRIPVKTGIASDTEIELISGLTEDSEVIIGIISANVNEQQNISPFGVGALRPGGFGGGARSTR